MPTGKTIPPQQANDQPPFDISDAIAKNCDQCGGALFTPAVRLGTISSMAPKNRTGQNVLVRFDTYICQSCGHEFGQKTETKQ